MKKLALGEQDFPKLREQNALYVDKTERIYEMLQFNDYLFLSRPRRFGKSLLVSTLAALYRGEKELFKGLWIEHKWHWEIYPVIRIDFSVLADGGNLEVLDAGLKAILEHQAQEYQVKLSGKEPLSLLNSLLFELHKATGKRVVVLIDEYDSPITSQLSNLKLAERNRTYLRNIYQVFKANSRHIHKFFITGISKFAKMSIFSVISHLEDLSLLPQFNDIVGFTKIELETYFADYLVALSEKKNLSVPALKELLTYWYDGFSWDGQNYLYNPYAIVKVFGRMELENFWFETGTPGFLIDLVKRDYGVESQKEPFLKTLDQLVASKETFDSYDLENINLTAALFQAGYLTIKEKIQDTTYTSYILGFPNYEVRHAFNAHLIKAFTKRDIGADIKGKALFLRRALKEGNQTNFIELIRSIFAGIPSNILKNVNEYTYQALFYQLLLLLGVRDIFLEVSGYIGRADGVLLLEQKVFVFEFKFARKGTMKTLLTKAATQAKTQGYWHPYLGTDQQIYRIAVGFLYKKNAKTDKTVLKIESHWKKIN